MANNDRYADQDRNRDRWRGQGGADRDDRGGGGRHEEDRGFFERAGETVGSWFGGGHDDRDDRGNYGRRGEQDYDRGYGRDRQDRTPGAHTDYYRGGDRDQGRTGPEGGFEQREEYRRSDRYAEQGQAGRGGHDDRAQSRGRDQDERYSGSGGGFGSGSAGGMGGGYGNNATGAQAYGTVGVGSGVDRNSHSIGGLGAAPEFSDGPRFDRQDVGHTGTHGVHPVSSRFGDAQRDSFGAEGAGMGAGGSSARARAIIQQAEQHGGRGRIEPGGQAPQGRYQERGGYGRQGYSQSSYGQQGGGQSDQFRRQDHDPHYSQWRQQQIESLDRDYDEYRRENASRFDSEFGSWRQKRGQQRQMVGRAIEHMEVVGSDGQHVGTVDKTAGDRIILTKSDPNAGGHHHSVPCSWIENVDDKVTLNKTAEEAMRAWRDEETSRALFEKPESGSGGPHVLERSFSGTYGDDEKKS